MICEHCGVEIHTLLSDMRQPYKPAHDNSIHWIWQHTITHCPACKRPLIFLAVTDAKTGNNEMNKLVPRFLAWPQGKFETQAHSEVDQHIREDYSEAMRILSISPKASAAMSRRCLQTILREKGGYAYHNLIDQIDAAIKETDGTKTLPSAILDTMDAIRQFGNFGAHPMTDQTTLQIIDVEDHEAEWCLDILRDLFDHYYVKPAAAKKRKDALNQKLAAAGKKPAK